MLATAGLPGLRTHAATVRLTSDDSSATVFLHVGDRLRVDLPAAPATGFRWAAKKQDASHLQAFGGTVRPDSGSLTAAGTQVFVWKAVSPGHAEIALAYSRPADDKTLPPARRSSIAVEIVAGELALLADGDPAALAGQTQAIYRGTLACEGCLGIAVELTLYSSPGRPTVFVERRRYLGAPGGDRTLAGTGLLSMQQGTYADQEETVYSLAAPDGSSENFRLAGDRLLPLDPQMLPLPPVPGHDYGLRKSPEPASAP